MHTTEMAMMKVVNDLLITTNNKKTSVLLAVDVSIAFDTLHHCKILHRAHELFGVCGRASDWLRSYLSG